MSLAAVATFRYVAGKLGVTGFQASCADMDILRQTRDWKCGKILNYDDLLYPQYCNEKHFPSVRSLLENKDVRPRLAELARESLANSGPTVHPDVAAHWRMLAEETP